MPSLAAQEPDAMVPLAHQIVARRRETADTYTLDFAPAGSWALELEPGQFVMVYVFGVGEVPISVSGIDADGHLTLTVRAVGAVSRAICAAVPGSILGLRGPCGNSWPIAEIASRDEESLSDVLVVAGGIGLAPLRPVIRHALAERERYGRIAVLYGARTPSDLLYVEELVTWRARGAAVSLIVDTADRGWRGQVGVVAKLVGATRFDPARAHAFVCGPEVMMHFTAEALLAREVAAERIHLSMERHMDCGIGLCGHCQLGPTLICRDGPIYTHAQIGPWMGVREL